MVPGIHSVLVALLSEKADVQYAADRISPDRIVAEIQALGFGAQLISETDIYQEGKLDLAVREDCQKYMSSSFDSPPSFPPLCLSSLPR